MVKNIKSKIIIAGVIIIIINILYFAFFYQNAYKPIKIAVDLTTQDTTTIWYVYKERLSKEKHFSQKTVIIPNGKLVYDYDLNSILELDYLGMYWKTNNPSSIIIDDFSYNVGNDKVVSKKLSYVSAGSVVNEERNSLLIKSDNNTNWVMLGDMNEINENREDTKNRSIFPVFYSILVFIIFILLGNKIIKHLNGLKRENKDLNTVKVYLLMTWVFLMPYWINISHIILALLVLLSLVEIFSRGSNVKLIEVIRNHKYFYLFYFLVIISSIIVSDPLQVIIDYSYFILVPIIFVNISKKQFNRVFNVFEIGIISYVVMLSLYITISFFQISPDINYMEFFKINSNIYWHSSYLCAFIMLIYLKRILQNNGHWVINLFYLVGIVFSYVIGARIAFLLMCALLFLILINVSRVKLDRKFKHYILLGIGIIFLVLAAYFAFSEHININEIDTIDARINLWYSSLEVIKQNPIFGVGVENTIESISRAFNNEIVNVKYRNYNAHNSFIEILMASGIISLIPFILIFRQLFKTKGILTCGFGICCILLFMVESYLQRQAGMIFFTFWSCFFLNYKNKFYV